MIQHLKTTECVWPTQLQWVRQVHKHGASLSWLVLRNLYKELYSFRQVLQVQIISQHSWTQPGAEEIFLCPEQGCVMILCFFLTGGSARIVCCCCCFSCKIKNKYQQLNGLFALQNTFKRLFAGFLSLPWHYSSRHCNNYANWMVTSWLATPSLASRDFPYWGFFNAAFGS